jgi:hypothetical protein
MFFSKHKRAAKTVSGIVSSMIRIPFLNPNQTPENTEIVLPYGFWLDDYIIGYCHMMGQLILKCDLRIQLEFPKSGEFIVFFFEHLCGDDATLVRRKFLEMAENQDSFPEFARGGDDADLAYAAMRGLPLDDDPSSLLAEAKKISPSRYRQLNTIGIETSTTTALGHAVLELSLMRYIKNKYLK